MKIHDDPEKERSNQEKLPSFFLGKNSILNPYFPMVKILFERDLHHGFRKDIVLSGYTLFLYILFGLFCPFFVLTFFISFYLDFYFFFLDFIFSIFTWTFKFLFYLDQSHFAFPQNPNF